MRLPHPDALPSLFERFGITDPSHQALLLLASETQHEFEEAVDRGEQPKASPIAQAEWQTAEALWIAVGLLPPIFAWPWKLLDALVGPVLAGDVWVIGGRTGDGKSTLLANLLRLLVWVTNTLRGVTVAPLEQSPAVFQLKQACLQLGFSIPDVFRQRWHRIPDPDAIAKVRQAVAAQGRTPLRETVRYCPSTTLDRAGLRALVQRAADWHHRLVIVDHLHQMDHGPGKMDEGIRKTMGAAKELARRYDMAILFTAQIGRPDKRDRRRKFYPPDLEDLQAGSAIEQVADGVLLLYQPLLPGIKVKDIDQVLMQQREYRSVFKANTAALLCGKHRLDGTARHKSVELHYENGVLSDLMPSWMNQTSFGAESDEQGDAFEATPGPRLFP